MILLSQPPRVLILQVCTTKPGYCLVVGWILDVVVRARHEATGQRVIASPPSFLLTLFLINATQLVLLEFVCNQNTFPKGILSHAVCSEPGGKLLLFPSKMG